MPKVTINGTIDPQRICDLLAAQLGCTATLIPKVEEEDNGREK